MTCILYSLSFGFDHGPLSFFIKPGVSLPWVRDSYWDNRGKGAVGGGGIGYGLVKYLNIYTDVEYTYSPFDSVFYRRGRVYPAVVDGTPYKISSEGTQSLAFSAGLKGELAPDNNCSVYGFWDTGIYKIAVLVIKSYYQKGVCEPDGITAHGWTASYGAGCRWRLKGHYEVSFDVKYRFLDQVVEYYVPTNKSAKDVVIRLGFAYRPGRGNG